MRKKIKSVLICICVLCSFAGCLNTAEKDSRIEEYDIQTTENEQRETHELTTNTAATEVVLADQSEKEVEDTEMINIIMTINNQQIYAKFYHNEATKALIEQMPFTVNMNDANKNEKYVTLQKELPTTSSERPTMINQGEIMCWNGDTLVVFYDTFANSYGGYTRLGFVEDETNLVDIMGKSSVVITFEVNQYEGD